MWARPYDRFLFQGCQIVKTFWWGQVYTIMMCPVPIRSGGPVVCQNFRSSYIATALHIFLQNSLAKKNVLENVFSAYLLVCLVCSAIKCAHNEHVFSCLVHACYGCHNRRPHSSARVEVGRGEASKSACCLLSLASTFHIKVGDAIWSRPDMEWPLWCVCALMSGGLWGFSQLKS